MHRALSVYANPNRRFATHLCNSFLAVELFARNRSVLAQATSLCDWFLGQYGRGHTSKRIHRYCFPDRRGISLPLNHSSSWEPRDMAPSCSVPGRSCDGPDCGAVAHPRDPTQSTLFQLRSLERPRALSRVLLGLVFQRAHLAFSEPPLSPRLRHSPASLVLAVQPALVVPCQRLSSRAVPAQV